MTDGEPEAPPESTWRRFVRGMMPWDQDPVLAVIGGVIVVAMAAGFLALIGLTAYFSWELAPRYPVGFGIVVGAVVCVIALVWLFRSRCKQCKRFFSARRIGTEVDHCAAPATLSSALGHVRVTGERVVIVRYYQCRRCSAKFTRRS